MNDTTDLDPLQAREIVGADADTIETFVTQYLLDQGIQIQLLEVLLTELFGQQVPNGGAITDEMANTPQSMIGSAISDVVDVGPFSGAQYSLQGVLDGAVSLQFLVRWARKVNPAVLPPNVIPSDKTVNAALTLFHASRQPISTS